MVHVAAVEGCALLQATVTSLNGRVIERIALTREDIVSVLPKDLHGQIELVKLLGGLAIAPTVVSPEEVTGTISVTLTLPRGTIQPEEARADACASVVAGRPTLALWLRPPLHPLAPVVGSLSSCSSADEHPPAFSIVWIAGGGGGGCIGLRLATSRLRMPAMCRGPRR